jgi:hypothetical protein
VDYILDVHGVRAHHYFSPAMHIYVSPLFTYHVSTQQRACALKSIFYFRPSYTLCIDQIWRNIYGPNVRIIVAIGARESSKSVYHLSSLVGSWSSGSQNLLLLVIAIILTVWCFLRLSDLLLDGHYCSKV